MLNLQKTDRYRIKMRWNTANMQPNTYFCLKEPINKEIYARKSFSNQKRQGSMVRFNIAKATEENPFGDNVYTSKYVYND